MVEILKLLLGALASAASVAAILYAIISLLSRPRKSAEAVELRRAV
jgi:hypothetical protein